MVHFKTLVTQFSIGLAARSIRWSKMVMSSRNFGPAAAEVAAQHQVARFARFEQGGHEKAGNTLFIDASRPRPDFRSREFLPRGH